MGSRPAAPRTLHPQIQPFLFIDAVDPLVVVPPAFPAQQYVDPPQPVTYPCSGDIPYPLPYGQIRPAVCPVIPDRGAQQRNLTGPAKGNTVIRYQTADHLSALRGFQNFFFNTS